MAGYEGLGGSGSQGEWPYPGSGPSGSSDTEAGLARFEALRYVDESDLPLGQGESGTPQDNRASAAAELRKRLSKIAETHEPTVPAAPSTPEDIRAALRDGAGVHDAPAPQTVEEIKDEEKRRALWRTEETLRNAPEVLVTAANQLESIIAGGNVPASVAHHLDSVVRSLRGINLHDLGIAQSYIGTQAHEMDMEANNRQ